LPGEERSGLQRSVWEVSLTDLTVLQGPPTEPRRQLEKVENGRMGDLSQAALPGLWVG